uniref:Apple domain-containing protein n=1 Tax=Meloidogyne hapla TaxID=6305 RepID=A0A1I8C0R8_MELHA
MVNIAKGKTPFECLSATFDLMENKCLLYGPGSSADGSVRLIPNINSIHFEKGCINQNLVNYCNGLPIYRYPQKSLIGYAIGSKYSDTLINCLENCWLLNNDENNNKKCKSVMFYYEENLNNNAQHNCILNSLNHQNIPSNYFVDENEVLVDYAIFTKLYWRK